MSGKGFKRIYNLSGGIKGWENQIAIGPIEQGLELFYGLETVEQVLIVGYGLEHGLREFYLDMIERVSGDRAKGLFKKLADIEILHQQQLLALYETVTGTAMSMEDFDKKLVQPSMEGGLSTEQYLQMFAPDLEKENDILSLAMSIEAQALDLYSRAADQFDDNLTKKVLQQIANEERAHIASLANYIDNLA